MIMMMMMLMMMIVILIKIRSIIIIMIIIIVIIMIIIIIIIIIIIENFCCFCCCCRYLFHFIFIIVFFSTCRHVHEETDSGYCVTAQLGCFLCCGYLSEVSTNPQSWKARSNRKGKGLILKDASACHKLRSLLRTKIRMTTTIYM